MDDNGGSNNRKDKVDCVCVCVCVVMEYIIIGKLCMCKLQ